MCYKSVCVNCWMHISSVKLGSNSENISTSLSVISNHFLHLYIVDAQNRYTHMIQKEDIVLIKKMWKISRHK